MEGMSNSLGDKMYLPPPSLAETLDLLLRLGELHLVALRKQRNSSIAYGSSLANSCGPWPLASLLVEDANIFVALKGTRHKHLALKYLGRA